MLPISDAEAVQLLQMRDENLRAWAIQLALEDGDAEPALLQALAEHSASERSWRVRLYLASALQRLPIADRWAIAEGLVAHADSQFDRNLPLMIWYGIEPLVPVDPARAMRMAAATPIPQVRQFIYRRAAVDPTLLDALVAEMADAKKPELQQLMVQELRGAAEKLGRVPMPKRWAEVAKTLATSDKPEVRQAVQFLSISFGDQTLFPMLRQAVADATTDVNVRGQALAALVQGKDPELAKVALGLLDDAGLRGRAIAALAGQEHAGVADAIIARYGQWPADVKTVAINTLLSRASYARALLDAMQAGKLPRSELNAVHVGKIQELKDEALLKQLQEVWGSLRATPEETKQMIAQLKNEYKPARLAKADRVAGRVLFTKTCGVCHRLFGDGSEIGPDLTGSNRASLDYLLENILDPNAVVGKDYQTVAILTVDGRVVSGLIREQSDAAIVVHDAQRLVTIPRSEIESVSQTPRSLMPEGMLKPLSPEEIGNLLAYLQSASQVALPGQLPAFDEAKGVVPGVLEGEALSVKASAGSAAPQGMGGFKADHWSGKSQVWWTGAKDGDSLDITFEAPQAGRYELFAVMTKALDYGIFNLTVDGKPAAGPIDLYNRPEVITTGPVSLGMHELTAGKHTLRVTIVGANAKAAPARMFGLDYLYLSPQK